MGSLLETLLQNVVKGIETGLSVSDTIQELLQEEETQKLLKDILKNPDVDAKDLLPTPVDKENDEKLKTDLEAIIYTTGRPVLLIKNDTFEKPVDPRWIEPLEAARKAIEFAVKAVGKVEIMNCPGFSYGGTAWLVTPDIVVTNRHVANLFAEKKANKFVFSINHEKRTMGAAINFKSEHTESDSQEEAVFKVKSILHIEEKGGPDIAFLRISQTGDSDSPLNADPIPLSKNSIEPDRKVSIIGYPAFSSHEPDYVVMRRIFNDIFNVKRLQPGEITQVTNELIKHDCSTLGGNSGSVVLDLETGEAVGIHFAGTPRVANYAVPASIIRERLEQLKLS